MTHSNSTTEIETVDGLLHAYAQGQRDFSSIALNVANLSRVNLKGADLSYADFADANFSQANLRGADLSYAVLRNANLASANLRGAMLIGTDLREANLAGAVLAEADYDPVETHFPQGFDPVAAGMKSDRQ